MKYNSEKSKSDTKTNFYKIKDANVAATENIVYGMHAVMGALDERPELVEKLYIRDGLNSPNLAAIYNACKANKIPVSNVPNDYKLDQMIGIKVNHQGLVAMTRDFQYLEIDVLLKLNNKDEAKLIIIMDEIEDPHNVGALIRTAVAVGATGVIVPKHRQAPISGAVYKTSAGTLNKISIARVSNIGVAIEKLKKQGYWVSALGMDTSVGKDINIKNLENADREENNKKITKDSVINKSLWESDLKGNLAIIVGNEGDGVHKHNMDNSDMVISIPMDNQVESLNASVSGAIAMYEWKRQNRV